MIQVVARAKANFLYYKQSRTGRWLFFPRGFLRTIRVNLQVAAAAAQGESAVVVYIENAKGRCDVVFASGSLWFVLPAFGD